ncbi:NADPH-dependent FMN reductase [Roseivirga sp. E12]|uniref:NADPH-dependent FMN reductase n=1 Tax=Roseivirga sp. E12 TaxID=2819237 RepID=UPI001ABC8634|nr:NAD(P)H-dependent oxidoreductase [Roseivirga sp. E12]MBO3698190.1 NAD(P)H-dependent oxidoreductase [Roseivirga sp. E12]
MKIVAFGASSSSSSINQKLAVFAANQIEGASVSILDLNDYEMPIYSTDKEKAAGIPQLAKDFRQHLADADGIIISFAEHNGSYSSAFKNVMDWNSRLDGKIWLDKPMFIMATSPGPRGGQTVLKQASQTFPYQGSDVSGEFSLPSFNQNFSDEAGITDASLRTEFENQLNSFISKAS